MDSSGFRLFWVRIRVKSLSNKEIVQASDVQFFSFYLWFDIRDGWCTLEKYLRSMQFRNCGFWRTVKIIIERCRALLSSNIF